MTDKDFYSIIEFAEKLGVHPNTIRRAIKSGRIAAFKVGKGERACFRIPANEIGRIALFDLREMIQSMIDKGRIDD